MKVKNKLLMTPEFKESVEALMGKEIPVKSCLDLAKFGRSVEEHLKSVDKARTSILTSYSELDENKNPITDKKTGEVVFKSEEVKKEALKKVYELLDQEFEYEFKEKIKLSENEKMKTSHLVFLQDLELISM